MKLKTLLTIAVTIASGAAISLPAQAIDGTITFAGRVIDATCNVTAGGGSDGNATVTLPAVPVSLLARASDTTGDTDFSIQLRDCTGATAAAGGQGVAVLFDPNGRVNTDGRLNSTGSADGVDLAIYPTGSATPLNLRVAPTAAYATITDGSATLTYTVKYFSTRASPAGGTVASTVAYTVLYL
ncbi:fimbrial protein [Pseudomonas sp. KB_15]|uniref:fimbrial protein n=1 Tax=Pseudomonas sp. KB_15 TaxID=3233035 RepID=UPI003F94BDF3